MKMKGAIMTSLIILLGIIIVGFIGAFVPFLSLVSWLGWVLIVVVIVKKTKEINNEKTQLYNEINALDREKPSFYEKIQRILQTEEGAFAKNTVPKDYFYSDAVGKFIYYLENGQADNMKEALKEYDGYVHRCRMEYEAARAAAAAERTAWEAARAANAAEQTAYNTAQIAESTRIIERHTASMAFWTWYDHL